MNNRCCTRLSVAFALNLLLGALPAAALPATQSAAQSGSKAGDQPDRIILTVTETPQNSAAVTWRSAPGTAGLAQILRASGSPNPEASATETAARTEPLQGDLPAVCHSVIFDDLEPDTVYTYRVGRPDHWSEWLQFRTASDQPQPFSFIYFGDAQNDIRSRWSRVIRQAVRDAPRASFLVHAGDLVNKGESDPEWHDWFGAASWMNGMVPSLPVPGNHEMVKGGNSRNRLSRHWRPQFTLPQNGPSGLEETCYTIVWQGVRLIALNSNSDRDTQAEWLDEVLRNNREKWTICVFHHPIFSAAKDRDNAELRILWKPVLDRHRVDLVLQGHDHTYARTGLETPTAAGGGGRGETFSGTVYVVSVSGPKMYEVRERPMMVRTAQDTQLYQVVHIDGDRLEFEAFTAAGELYDGFTLTKNPMGINTLTETVPTRDSRIGRLP